MGTTLTGQWLTVPEFCDLRGASLNDVRQGIKDGILETAEVSTPNGPRLLIWAQDAQPSTPRVEPMMTRPFARGGGKPPKGRYTRTYEHRLKTGAGKLGIPVSEYQAHIEAGERWCIGCRTWHRADAFGTSSRRPGSIAQQCKVALNARSADRYRAAKGGPVRPYGARTQDGRFCAGHRSWHPAEAYAPSALAAGPGGARCIAWHDEQDRAARQEAD